MSVTPAPPFNPNDPNSPRPPGYSPGGGALPPGWNPRRTPQTPGGGLNVTPDPNGGTPAGQAPGPAPSGLAVPQPGQVGGPWGGTLYPEWFQRGIGPNMSPEHAANLFADFVSQNPTMDFGFYWNQFRPGSMMGDRGIRFGTGTPGNPAGTPQAQPGPGGDVVTTPAPGEGTNVDGNTTMEMGGRRNQTYGGLGGNSAQAPPQANRNSVQRPQSPQAQQATAKQPPVQVIVQSGGGQAPQAPAPSFSSANGAAPGKPTRLGAQPMRSGTAAPQTSLQRPPNTGLGVSPGNPTPQRKRPGGIGSNY